VLYVHTDRNGRETWYGRWREGGRRVDRKIGPKRPSGSDGLTRTQAEARLRNLIATVRTTPAVGERVTVAEAARRYLEHLERRGRKPSTIGNIESETRMHLVPFFRDRTLASITRDDVADLVRLLERKRLAPKSIRNIVGTLSALCNYAKAPQRRWATSNPCDGVELPAVPDTTAIRYLDLDATDLLVANARPGMFQAWDAALYRTAAMTGLRRGELLALRWRDVDWLASRIRVRQNYVRGEFGTPKSRRSTRSVPMALDVAAALETLSKTSRWTGDDELVFAHPATGEPPPVANIQRRMRRALTAAGLDPERRFHDLRHTFGTHMAAAGVPMTTLKEWMGHRDLATTQIYADYAPGAREADLVAAAFTRSRDTDDEPAET
jgi:integrase